MCREGGGKVSACYFPFSFFLIFSLDVGDPERESYGAQVAPQIKTPPGPSMFFFFVRFFTSTDAHSLILSPLLFFQHAHTHMNTLCFFILRLSLQSRFFRFFFLSLSLSSKPSASSLLWWWWGKVERGGGRRGRCCAFPPARRPDLTSTSPINFCYILSRSIFLNFIFKFFTAIKLIYLLG